MTPETERIPWKKAVSWSFFDWANSAFATTVMAGFFPVFYRGYWNAGVASETISARLALANTLASVLVAAASPFLGAVADRGGAKKKFLLFFTVLGIVMTGCMPLVAKGQWLPATILFLLAMIGFSGGLAFYDSLLPSVSPPSRFDFVSGMGYSAGYLGGGLLFLLNVVMVQKPELFGLADSAAAVKAAFVTVAVWWAVFAIPLFLFVEEPKGEKAESFSAAIAAGWRQFIQTFHEVRALRPVLFFLIGFWLYNDGVGTIMRMAVDYGLTLGLAESTPLKALLLVQFIGFPAALAFGRLGEWIGTKRGLYIAIAAYAGASLYAPWMKTDADFYALAVVIGLVQGGVQSLSRSYFARLVPKEKSGEFFGFYNMVGKFSAIVGPQLMTLATFLTGQQRFSFMSLIILFAVGAFFLSRVREPQADA